MEKQRRQKFIFWIFVYMCAAIWVSLFFINQAWPAEPISPLSEVEKWQVVSEVGSFGNLITIKYHQDPSDPNKAGVSLWFPNKAKNYEYEAFVRMTNFAIISRDKETSMITKMDGSQSLVSLKLENGAWTEPMPGVKSQVGVGLLNGERAIIYRTVNDNGETKFFRAFLLKDLIKLKN